MSDGDCEAVEFYGDLHDVDGDSQGDCQAVDGDLHDVDGDCQGVDVVDGGVQVQVCSSARGEARPRRVPHLPLEQGNRGGQCLLNPPCHELQMSF